jgi:hypothetical protein
VGQTAHYGHPSEGLQCLQLSAVPTLEGGHLVGRTESHRAKIPFRGQTGQGKAEEQGNGPTPSTSQCFSPQNKKGVIALPVRL